MQCPRNESDSSSRQRPDSAKRNQSSGNVSEPPASAKSNGTDELSPGDKQYNDIVDYLNKKSKELTERGSGAKEVDRERRQSIDDAAGAELRRQERVENSNKWRCYGENGNVQRGFGQCLRECERHYSYTHCEQTCYESGSGSVARGRSCFKLPE
jgi:hypothetical protein